MFRLEMPRSGVRVQFASASVYGGVVAGTQGGR